ncbi:MAG: TniQ family protein [Moraxellaceae bacterium]
MLMIRPYPRVGESQAGYALRLAAENDYENGLEDLRKLLGHKCVHRVTYWRDETMNYLLGRRFSYENIPLRYCGANGQFRLTYNSKLIDSYHYSRHSQKYCPQCIKESPYFRGDWDLSFVTVCDIHQCILVDHCEQCNRPVSWKRRSHLHCNCGHPMSETQINTPTKPEVIAIQKLILASLFDRQADPEIFVAFPELFALKDIKNGEIGKRIIEGFYRYARTEGKFSVNSSIPLPVTLIHEAVLLFSTVVFTSNFVPNFAAWSCSQRFSLCATRLQLKGAISPLSTGQFTAESAVH